jgi:hypothetical protein
MAAQVGGQGRQRRVRHGRARGLLELEERGADLEVELGHVGADHPQRVAAEILDQGGTVGGGHGRFLSAAPRMPDKG